MRRDAKLDANHKLIVRALRQIGCSVQSLASQGMGCPDLVVGFRGVNYLFEVKDGRKQPSQRKLTAMEKVWHDTWRGQVCIVESIDDALKIIVDSRI